MWSYKKSLWCFSDFFNVDSQVDTAAGADGCHCEISAVGKGNGDIRIQVKKGGAFFLVGNADVKKGAVLAAKLLDKGFQ